MAQSGQQTDPRVDDLDKWARQMSAWLTKVYEWFIAVHNTVHPRSTLGQEVPPPPQPPPYPPPKHP